MKKRHVVTSIQLLWYDLRTVSARIPAIEWELTKMIHGSARVAEEIVGLLRYV